MTLENLLYNIGKTAIRNRVINYAAAGGSVYELNAETIQDYPILFASPTGQHEVRVNTTDYEISLYYLDRLLRDSSNDIQIYSTAVEQLKLVLRMIEDIEGVVEVAPTYNISNFTETESMNDRVAGAFTTLTITVLNISDCDNIAVIQDFINLQKKTIEITENGIYEIGYDGGYEGLDVVTIDVEVPDLNGSYEEGYNEGKTDGYAEGYETGNTEGYTEGKTEGYNEGKADGYTEGYSVGQAEGVDAYVETLPTLDITENGTYDTINKGVNVNVIPKVNVQETKLKFGYSTFTEIPEWVDWTGITDMSYMFYNCTTLQSIPLIDTSSCTNMRYMFGYCSSLTSIPALDTSSCTDMERMLQGCTKLQTIPALNTSKVTTMQRIFYNCTSLTSIPALDCSSISPSAYNGAAWFGNGPFNNITTLGGFLNLKTKSDSSYGLVQLPNLTYESCINVLNGLYDFEGNSEIPDSNQGKLKVHANFLTTVGDEISIGVNKGWTITS